MGSKNAPVGAYCSHRTMPADLMLRLPNVPDDLLAGHPLRGITASFLRHEVHLLTAGQTVPIHAAAGGVGQILAQRQDLGTPILACQSGLVAEG